MLPHFKIHKGIPSAITHSPVFNKVFATLRKLRFAHSVIKRAKVKDVCPQSLATKSVEVASAQDRHLTPSRYTAVSLCCLCLTAQILRREIPPSMLGTYNHYFSSRLPFPVVAIFAKYKINIRGKNQRRFACNATTFTATAKYAVAKRQSERHLLTAQFVSCEIRNNNLWVRRWQYALNSQFVNAVAKQYKNNVRVWQMNTASTICGFARPAPLAS